MMSAKKSSYKHAEGFCLMKYRCRKCGHTEKLYNTRDGVTPFILICPKCDAMSMQHTEWSADERIPDFKPPVGMRVFVDLTKEKFREYKKRLVEKHWNDKKYPVRKMYKTKEDAVASLMEGFEEGMPDIVVVEGGTN